MPQVASDPVVQQPRRPESLGRAGASSGEQSGSFEVLLDNGSATPRTEQPERASRARASDRTDQTRTDDRNQPRAETRRSQDTGERASTSNPTKPADTSNTRQAKNGQSSDTSEPVVDAAVTAAKIAPVPVVDFTAIVAAITVDAGDAKPDTTDTGKPAVTAEKTTAGSSDKDAAAADTRTADVTAVIVAVATPVQAPVAAVSVTPDPTVDPAAVAPAGVQAAAPAIPADATAPDAPVPPAVTPDIATPADAAPAKPQAAADAATTPTDKTAPSDDSQKAAALKAAGLVEPIETPDTKSPAPADRKADAGKAKSDRPVASARTTDAQPRSDAAKPATDTTADPQPKAAPHQPHEPSAEHASPAARAAVADVRAELPAIAAAPAQLNAAAPAVPFNLVAPLTTPLAAMPQLVALHVDPSSDNAIPVAGLAVEIVSRAQDGLKRFDIRLDPPELGRIDVRLDVDSGGKVTSRLVVERAETLDLLRRDAPQLERALQHAGLNTEGGLEFSLRDQNFANRDQGPRDLPTTHLIVPDDEPAAAEVARRGYGRLIGLGGGVDIRV